jgi:2-(1,2-epoxy-1,2-dihydrophenyl)acetyl-CoA isomerase
MTSLIVDRRDGVWTLRLNRPEHSNALDEELLDDLDGATLEAERADHVAAVVVGGNGSNFCAGGDLAMLRRWQGLPPEERERLFRAAQQIVLRLVRLPVPVIAAVRGAVVGAGLDLALAADLCLAEAGVWFRSGFVAVGLVRDFGGSWRLPRSIGAARAREMILANVRVDAVTAQAWGMVHRVVDSGTAIDSALALAQELRPVPRAALAAAKRCTNAAWATTFEDSLDLAAAYQSHLMDDPEHLTIMAGGG